MNTGIVTGNIGAMGTLTPNLHFWGMDIPNQLLHPII